MKRINVNYDGTTYSIGQRELSEVQDEIATALASGKPHWLQVNYGEGTVQTTMLLIHAGIGIALMPVSEPDPSGVAHPVDHAIAHVDDENH